MSKLKKFDAAEYLDTPERQAAYLAAAMETGDATFVRDALGIVARAVGLSKVANRSALEPCKSLQGPRPDGQSWIWHRDGHLECAWAYHVRASRRPPQKASG
jgi:hypothetical protein